MSPPKCGRGVTRTVRHGDKLLCNKADRLFQDVRENMGAPTSQCKQRRSMDWYIDNMALMSELVEIEPSSFEEVIEKPIWVDVMVEEYDSIVRNNVWEVVPRPTNKSVVGLRWIYKVKHATYGSIEKHKAKCLAKGFS